MKLAKASSAEDYKLISSYEEVRKTLLDEKFSDRLEKPLAFWALPNDRRLPLAFLGRTLNDLLNTPFEELSATPGIGQKKIGSLVKLLHRAINEEPPSVPFSIPTLMESPDETQEGIFTEESMDFDPTIVSEALWVKWQETIRKHNVDHEKLGRLAPTLQALPTVIWHTPLSEYLNYSVAEIRQFKTHGEKRVRVVLEVFYVVHEMLSNASPQKNVAIQLVPSFIIPIQQWIAGLLDRPRLPSVEEIQENSVVPLLEQTRVDAGDTVFRLIEGRLGVLANPQSVRTQSRRMGVTRARVYQLLDECCKVMNVRWPEGKRLLGELSEMFKSEGITDEALKQFAMTRELFYPEKYDKIVDEEED